MALLEFRLTLVGGLADPSAFSRQTMRRGRFLCTSDPRATEARRFPLATALPPLTYRDSGWPTSAKLTRRSTTSPKPSPQLVPLPFNAPAQKRQCQRHQHQCTDFDVELQPHSDGASEYYKPTNRNEIDQQPGETLG